MEQHAVQTLGPEGLVNDRFLFDGVGDKLANFDVATNYFFGLKINAVELVLNGHLVDLQALGGVEEREVVVLMNVLKGQIIVAEAKLCFYVGNKRGDEQRGVKKSGLTTLGGTDCILFLGQDGRFE